MNLNRVWNNITSGLMFVFICYLMGKCRGFQGGMNLSRHEEMKIEKQLKLLNKPAIKTIQTEYGELFDCVDFYKQPAFDHPLLKNHSYHFQMKPKFPVEKEDQPSAEEEKLHYGLKDGGCPEGTVPIKRTTKEDLIRQKFASKDSILGRHFKNVAMSTHGDLYTGALGFLSTYQPAPVKTYQFSAARIHLQNDYEFIQFGWRVDPALYGDAATHFYIQTDTPTTKCFDIRCSGFVVTNKGLSPGLTIPYISTIGGVTYETKPRVQRDVDGNWWLSLERDNKHIGFWPKEIFTKMTEFANYVEWGGEVDSPPPFSAPPMGSGIKPDILYGNRKTNAYFRWIAGIDRKGIDFNPYVELYWEDFHSIFYYNIVEQKEGDPWGHQIYFGGNSNEQ